MNESNRVLTLNEQLFLSFKERLAKYGTALGAMLLWDIWNGSRTKHQIQYQNGHIGWIWPSNINSGCGCCRLCAGREWDVFYLVHDPIMNHFKLGVTSNDPDPRLSTHKRDSFYKLLYLILNVDARELETQLLDFLSKSDYLPYRGNEYFSDDSLDSLLKELEAYGLENVASERNQVA
jgi:hypothetical protein